MNKLPNYEQSVIDAFASQGTENGLLGGSEECKIGTVELNRSARKSFLFPFWSLHCSLIKCVQTFEAHAMQLGIALTPTCHDRSTPATAQIQYISIRRSKLIFVIKAVRVYVDLTERRLAL